MSDRETEGVNLYAVDAEDTAETSLAGRFFLWRWYKRTTRGFGASRGVFMPIGFLALSSLAFHLGFPALEELTDRALTGVHHAIGLAAGAADAEGGEGGAGSILSLQSRRAAVPVFALGWASLAALLLAFGARPPKKNDDELGYVVPGSGFFARSWGVIGKRIWQLKRAIKFLLAYLRDLNLQKIHLPVSLLLLLALGFGALALALENVLWELPLRFSGLRDSTDWIAPSARIAATIVVLVLGIPMLANSLLKAHEYSVRLRTKEKVGFVRRRLKGLFGVVFVFLPLAWMVVRLFGGHLT